MERSNWGNEERLPRWNTTYSDSPAMESDRWGGGNVDEETRKRLAEGTAALNRTSASLSRSIQVAEETEVIGAEVAGELSEQRESLLRTRQRLEDVNQDLSRTRRLLRTMYVRVIANKFILGLLIFLEVAIIVALVYVRFLMKKS
ncbi:vesicle transport through interaction with t-SNAREs homolog 1B isoform X1 [Ischnura elegans]|uniref:vesicle transport through interaction with t-SNAREs homolog 1B isoform X1 n=2 Tax=Ischnura elegans TaxID=197161 RepID=UPI001ED87CEB|nr:vesicle transport through interaction with t-SNAREs homolog 1B isoform X1 [Ischnura elegans]